MKKIGILGGISLASTIEYYRAITDLYYARFQNYHYPEIFINSLDFQYFTDLENQNRMDEYRAYILGGLQALADAGADFAIMAANSPHSVYDDIAGRAPLPLLSIMDAVARRAAQRRVGRVLLTGIYYTMSGSFYPRAFARHGIETVVPNEEQKRAIDDIIFGELVLGRVTERSRERFLSIIGGYDVDAVLLGCTELPQLVQQHDTDRLLLDSLAIHCEDALAYALAD